MLKSVAEIRDPIHGYIYITEVERSLIDTYSVQRLRRIKQLSGAYLTYPGAEHSRFTHSLGVMHLAGELANHFIEMGYINDDDAQKIRIAGLLHDIGHGPFSHTYEELLDNKRNMTHEDITRWLIKKSELSDILSKNGYIPENISELSIGYPNSKKESHLNNIIGSQFDVDTMDYLLRDSYFTGVEYGRIDTDRLIYSLDIIEEIIAMDITALYALESFVIARYEMFKAVYFHRTVRAAQVMIAKAMINVDLELGLTSFKTPEEFLLLDDSNVILKILSLKNNKERELRYAYQMIEMYIRRNLFKCTYEVLIHHRDDFFTSIMSRDEVRIQLAKEIGIKSGVDERYIIIDVPTVISIPYYPLQKKPSDMPVFKKNLNGTKVLQNLSEHSRLVDVLIGFIDAVRVYTAPQFRDAVSKASADVFSKQPFSTKITL